MTDEEYIKTLTVNGQKIDLGLDDYGQQYFIEWEDEEGKHESGLGAYNLDYMSSILHMFDPDYRRILLVVMDGRSLSEEDDAKFKSYIEAIRVEGYSEVNL